jgi:hypothetical protein
MEYEYIPMLMMSVVEAVEAEVKMEYIPMLMMSVVEAVEAEVASVLTLQ